MHDWHEGNEAGARPRRPGRERRGWGTSPHRASRSFCRPQIAEELSRSQLEGLWEQRLSWIRSRSSRPRAGHCRRPAFREVPVQRLSPLSWSRVLSGSPLPLVPQPLPGLHDHLQPTTP